MLYRSEKCHACYHRDADDLQTNIKPLCDGLLRVASNQVFFKIVYIVLLKPPAGSGLLFYNFGPGLGGRRCHLDTLHRANPVTRGAKEVVQKWYGYSRWPFRSARPFRRPGDGMKAWQPQVSCDYTEAPASNVSCRWYNEHKVWAPS